MSDRSVSIRLGTEGKATVKADFDDIASSGDAAAKRLVNSYDKAGDDIEKALARRDAAAAKIQAMMPTGLQSTIMASAGTSARGGYRDAGGGADDGRNASASEYAALLAQQERQVAAVHAAIDPLYVAQKRYDDEVRVAGELAKNGAISEAEHAAALRVSAQALEQARAAQDRLNASWSTGADADAHVQAYARSLATQEQQATALRAKLDPLWAAQKRYDDEVATADGLLKRGLISEAEHSSALGESSKALEKAKQELAGHSNALSLNRNQFIIAESAVHRFVDSILAGQNPLRALALQGGDIANVLSMDDGGVAGGLAKVRALFNPVTIGVLGVTAALAAGTAAWLSYSNAMEKEAALVQGAGAVIGASGAALEDNARKAASAGNISVASAREIESGYVQMGGIGTGVLAGLTSLTTDFAKATGQDAKGAQQELGRAFQDPVKGAEELTARYGTLTQAQIDHIQELVQQNDLYGAQAALLAGLKPQFDDAAAHANILAWAWHGIADAASDAWTSMGKAIDVALGGGDTMQQIANVYKQRDQWLQQTMGRGDTSYYDKQISDLQKQLKAEQEKAGAAGARSRAVSAMGLVDGVTGDDARGKLEAGRAQIAAVVNDSANKAGLTADQLKRARAALDDYTHAVQTYLPEGEKQVRLSQLDAQIAATKDPAKKAALATQKSEIEQSGKLVSSTQALAIATAAGDKARSEATGHGDKHAQTLAREAAAQDASARAALDVAAAYLQSDAAGAEAEARRKAITDATKKGTDVEAEARRQIALSVANGVASSTKSIAGLRQETAARTEVDMRVEHGTLAIGLMNQALSDEALLRPLLTMQALAHGDAIAQLAKEVDAYREALKDAHAEEAHGQALQSLDALHDRLQDAQLAFRYAGDTTGAADRARARLAANREADQRGYNDNDRAAVVQGSVDAVNAENRAHSADTAATALRTSRDQLEVTQAEIGLIGKSADEHDRVVDRLKLQQQLAGELKDNYAEFAPAILAAADAVEHDQQRLKQLQGTMSELQDAGGQFIDTLFNPNGDVLKSLLREVEQELLKLAAINPLKNLLGIGGGGLPTLSSVMGLLGGRGFDLSANTASVSASLAASNAAFVPHFAAGTDYSSAGAALVGENGPEVVDLPLGSRVTNASDTRRMLSASNDSGATHNHFHLEGAVVTQQLLDQMNAIGARAAQQGSDDGFRRSRDHAARTRRYSYSQS